MRLARAALWAVILACAFGRLAAADCPVVMLSGSAQIQPSNCGPIVYNGGSSATLTLPAAPWRGMVVNESGAAITLVGASGAPVNDAATGVSLPSNTGGTVTGDPAAGWHYSGPTGSFGGTPGGTSGQLQINSSGAFGGTSAPSGLTTVGIAANSSDPAYAIGNGGWFTNSIPYLRPTVSNTGIAFDLVPNGTQTTVWEDICDTDIVANSAANYECLHLQKDSAGTGEIYLSNAGTGSVRDLALQNHTSDADPVVTGERVFIGLDTSPIARLEIVHNPTGAAAGENHYALGILSQSNDTYLGVGTITGSSGYSYLQSEQKASSYTNRPLVMMPNGGDVTVGAYDSGQSTLFEVNGSTNLKGAVSASGTAGVTCSGTPTSSFAATNGIVTHC